MMNWISVSTRPEFFADFSMPGISRSSELLLWIPKYGAYTGKAVLFQDGTVEWSCGQICGDIRPSHWVKITSPEDQQ